jgi:hypothetical protein
MHMPPKATGREFFEQPATFSKVSKRFIEVRSNIRETGDASELLQLAPDKRIHAMKALSRA